MTCYTLAATAELEKTGKGLITHTSVDIFFYILFWFTDDGTSGLEAGIKWRPNQSELPELGSEFREIWDSFYANSPDKPVLWMGIISACAN